MQQFVHGLLAAGLACWLSTAGLAAGASGRVELELVTEARVSILAQQQWLRRLSQAGITGVRLRTSRGADKVGIEVRGLEAAPVYKVTGIITSDDVLVLPGARFRSAETGRVVQWVQDLARLGPEDQRPAKAAFGLNVNEFQQLHDAMALQITGTTQGLKRAEVVRSIARSTTLPVQCHSQVLEAVGDDPVGEELSGLTCGTALAYALRPPGFCLVPRASSSGIELEVVPAKPDLKTWPIGWKAERPDREVLPALFEFLNVRLDGVSVTKVLEALGPRLKVPILIDHNAMARHGINPDEAFVDFPQGRTTHGLLLKKALFQARLKYELRIDEADTPFLWITTVMPLSREP